MVRAPLFDPTSRQEFVASWQQLDWQLLQNSHVHRYRDNRALLATCDELVELGYLVHRLDAHPWSDAAALHTALARTLQFPSHYGRNLDALEDMLRDVAEFDYGSDPAATGTAVALAGYDTFTEREPMIAQNLLDIWARIARYGFLVGHPMLCLVTAWQEFAPVGATRVVPTLPPSSSPSE